MRLQIMSLLTTSLLSLSLAASDMPQEKPPQLTNVDDTCYLNSTLQAVDNISTFRPYLNDAFSHLNQETADVSNKYVLHRLAGARQYMHNPLYKKTWGRYCQEISNHMQGNQQQDDGSWIYKMSFRKNRQQDATELINTVISQLEDMYPDNEELTKLFHIKFSSEITDPATGRCLNQPSTHKGWPIQIGPFSNENRPSRNTTLTQLITRYSFAPQEIEYRHEETGELYKNAQKHDKLRVCPQYLVVQITPRSFSQDEYVQQLQGESPQGSPLNITITVPEYIRCTKEDEASEHGTTQLPLISPQHSEEKGVNYRLNNMIVHRKNNNNSGHYWAYVRKGDTWYKCNDRNIHGPKEGVTSFPSKWTPSNGVSPYLLFYERTDDEVPSIDEGTSDEGTSENSHITENAEDTENSSWSAYWNEYKQYIIGGTGAAGILTGLMCMFNNMNK